MAALLPSVTLRDVAQAVIDELGLSTDASINQVTIIVTCSVHRYDFIDEWYDEYVRQQDEREIDDQAGRY